MHPSSSCGGIFRGSTKTTNTLQVNLCL